MSNLTQFVGSALLRSPTSLVNGFSDGGLKSTYISRAQVGTSGAGKKILSGALTADTDKNILEITGSGSISYLGVQAEDTTSREVGIKVTIDGTVVFDADSATITALEAGIRAIGDVTTINYGRRNPSYSIPFNVSLKVEIRSSKTETNKVSLICAYYLF